MSKPFKPIPKPTDKSPEYEAHLTKLTGINRREAITSLKCPFCKQDVLGFRDALSQREHQISGLCQKCQDEMFGK
jgi:hypothetical protein